MAKDPYRYFRVEARELVDGLARAALELERGQGGGAPLAAMRRLAHTLKGAAAVVRLPAIAGAAHVIEDLIAPPGDGQPDPGPKERADAVLRALDGISSQLAALEPEAPGAEAQAALPEALQGTRVEIAEMDAIVQGIAEAGARVAGTRRHLDDLELARASAGGLADMSDLPPRARAIAAGLQGLLARVARDAGGGLDRADRELEALRDRAERLRLLPTSTIFPTLDRAVRDAARTLDRDVAFEASGGEARLEAHVLVALRDALLHVVRNAVAHGIEPARERRSAGKPAQGRVTVTVERRGTRVAFTCRDDGRGIDVEAARRAAIARGVTTAAGSAALGREELLRLVLESGVTTTQTVSELSGRGVGLDVLRQTVAGLKGEVTVSSQPGAGTIFEVRVPMEVSSIAVLALRVEDGLVTVPFDSVRGAVRLGAGDFVELGGRDAILVDGTPVPFLPLHALVAPERPRDRARSWSAVIIHAGEQSAALGADRLVGTARVVVRPAPRVAGTLRLVSGVWLDLDGTPRLLLEPAGLVAAAHGPRAAPARAKDVRPRAPILVVDDSLTTRILEQSILESSGYAVELATSGEEGFARAKASPPSLFVVDVEMPGMNGFEFVERARADPALQSIPAILVSSLDGAEHRRRGEEAGARAYIVKGDFDQGQFLATIRRLIG